MGLTDLSLSLVFGLLAILFLAIGALLAILGISYAFKKSSSKEERDNAIRCFSVGFFFLGISGVQIIIYEYITKTEHGLHILGIAIPFVISMICYFFSAKISLFIHKISMSRL